MDIFCFTAWFWGDPHIHTLDGLEYTFNGLGEFTMVGTQDASFTLQGRTLYAQDANGTDIASGTVWGAFAVRGNASDIVQVQMNTDRTGECAHLIFFVVFSLCFFLGFFLNFFNSLSF